MSNERQINYVNEIQNRVQNLYYVDDASELNSIDLKENDKIYAINDDKLFQMEIADQEEELSGSIVSFNGRNNTKIKSVVTNIEPVQDLHGYDNPWPAGGGKNKISPTAYTGASYNMSVGATITLSEATDQPTVSGNTITLSIATAWVGYVFKTGALSAGTYNVHADVTDTPRRRLTFYVVGSDNVIKYKTASYSNDIENRSYTVSDNDYIAFFATSDQTCTFTLKDFQVESGSSYTSWTPYSNECPISGWTGANIEHTGSNIWNGQYEQGNILSDGTNGTSTVYNRTKGYITAIGGEQYYMACTGTKRFFWYDRNKQLIMYDNTHNPSTAPENACYLRSMWQKTDITDPTAEVSINYPSTDTEYHAYHGQTIPITFPTTIYGGTDEVIGGALESTLSLAKIKDLTWVFESNYNRFRTNNLASTIKYPSANNTPLAGLISSAYRTGSATQTGSAAVNGTIGVSISGTLYILDTAFTDVATFVTAMGEEQIVYPLATPAEYTLSANELTTLLSTNNIWSDIGDITVKIAEKGITAFELEPYN